MSPEASTAPSILPDISRVQCTPAEAILAAVLYADLFDYPLSVEEIYRYQVGTGYSQAEIEAVLAEDESLHWLLASLNGLYALRGREQVFDLRALRETQSRRLWPRARRYARLASRLPFVRFVAVTGALAVDNLGARPDIDLLVVAAPGRVWICRRMLIFLVRLARIFGDELCPNYIISAHDLRLDQRDFFTAHELAQMVPLAGLDIYHRMIASNRWTRRFLPCALRKVQKVRKQHKSAIKQLMEAWLARRAFDRWERWEMERMRKQLRPILGQAAEVVCSAEQCKGHTGLHRQSVLGKYVDVLRSRELYGALHIVEQDLGTEKG